jgi:glycosyltransferase involved in cell wall biosynthesis
VLGGFAARLCVIRAVVWGVRSTSIGGVLPHWRLRILCRLSALMSHRVPSAIVCVAEAARLSHIDFGYRADQMHVIANGFDIQALDPSKFDASAARALHGFAPDHIVVGHVGRYCNEKDHVGFLKAARLALDREPALRFVMAGRAVSPSNPVLMSAIESLRLSGHVRLLGERPDVAAVLRSFDMFCLSSTFEGFPNVLGEAMAMALPCASTDAGDARVLVGDAAEIVPISDPHAMAHALSALARLTRTTRPAGRSRTRTRRQSLHRGRDASAVRNRLSQRGSTAFFARSHQLIRRKSACAASPAFCLPVPIHALMHPPPSSTWRRNCTRAGPTTLACGKTRKAV